MFPEQQPANLKAPFRKRVCRFCDPERQIFRHPGWQPEFKPIRRHDINLFRYRHERPKITAACRATRPLDKSCKSYWNVSFRSGRLAGRHIAFTLRGKVNAIADNLSRAGFLTGNP